MYPFAPSKIVPPPSQYNHHDLDVKNCSPCLNNLLSKCLSRHVSVEGLRIPRLQEDRPRTGELADETFAGADSADDASRSHALHNVLAIPRNKMPIVDDIAFALNQLPMQSAKSASPQPKSSKNLRLS